MQINLEASELHAVQSYSNDTIRINSIDYLSSLIVSKQEIISDLTIKSILNMDKDYVDLLLRSKPEVIIIGHEETGRFPPMAIVGELSRMKVGIEFMSIGAAARTYNILLGEGRKVVVGFIL